MRLFLALRLPAAVLDALEAWGAEHLHHGGRRVPREHLHVTLAFLGHRPGGDLPVVLDALRSAAAASAPFPLAVARWRETRSVGMLVLEDPTGAGGRLAADLAGHLDRRGLAQPERRPWLAHVTMLRFASRPRLAPPLPAVRTFVPSDAAAYISRLHPAGARYEVLDSTPLGNG